MNTTLSTVLHSSQKFEMKLHLVTFCCAVYFSHFHSTHVPADEEQSLTKLGTGRKLCEVFVKLKLFSFVHIRKNGDSRVREHSECPKVMSLLFSRSSISFGGKLARAQHISAQKMLGKTFTFSSFERTLFFLLCAAACAVVCWLRETLSFQY